MIDFVSLYSTFVINADLYFMIVLKLRTESDVYNCRNERRKITELFWRLLYIFKNDSK